MREPVAVSSKLGEPGRWAWLMPVKVRSGRRMLPLMQSAWQPKLALSLAWARVEMLTRPPLAVELIIQRAAAELKRGE
ncbi:hypothetical protein KIM372_04380 [Bombiscardovia nodaiensis]|uniref:Uncharacterized protein n=1 Tax=Bombiscardovia nodaiensis TaxID=2932181 RepID=A0ABN6SBN5_9BIFI|nr:hypothetical protein KIM372_04380 [Bombiscardovia nodaiensis]